MQKINTQKYWGSNDIHNLLSPEPLTLEMGISRQSSGALLVAVRTDMPHCKGEMLDWWFSYFDSTEHIKWWHPRDHTELKGWDDKRSKGKSYIGATVEATEALANLPPLPAKLKFHAPTDFFDADIYEQAKKTKAISAAICSTIGFGDDVKLDNDGDPVSSEMMHLTRDTEFGCVLRSRFLLGKDGCGAAISDETGLNLMRHCYNEFTYLSRVLPSLYFSESKPESVPVPW